LPCNQMDTSILMPENIGFGKVAFKKSLNVFHSKCLILLQLYSDRCGYILMCSDPISQWTWNIECRFFCHRQILSIATRTKAPLPPSPPVPPPTTNSLSELKKSRLDSLSVLILYRFSIHHTVNISFSQELIIPDFLIIRFGRPS
jgi:hypothetical protein